MTPRPYQSECLGAIDSYLREREGNPCVVLPTGAGKTPVMAWLIQRYVTQWPETRILILAHVRELLAQGVEKMRAIWPAAPIGIYSAGLGRKDVGYGITYASIQSVHKKARLFPAFDLILIDEAHRIPLAGETTYRNFLREAKEAAALRGKPYQRLIGFTATAFRLDGGAICGPEHLLNEVCYEAGVRELIECGYLCRLTSRAGKNAGDFSGVPVRRGEFVEAEVMAVVGTGDMVAGAVNEALARGEGRQAFIFFCVNVIHAHMVSEALAARGFEAPVISAETPAEERDAILRRFQAGAIRGICNVNVLSEGFDAQRIDCVVLLRPTASAGLFYQQVGRGLRIHPAKNDCLVLDFAGNTQRHGPIDTLKAGGGNKGDGTGVAPTKVCPECQEIVAAGKLVCLCGFEFPPREIEHAIAPAGTPILSEPETFVPTEVDVQRTQKEGKPPALRVIYFDGASGRSVSEFICLEHGAYPASKARAWWRARFGEPVPATVDGVMADLFLASKIQALTESLQVRRNGKYYDVLSVKLRQEKMVRPV